MLFEGYWITSRQSTDIGRENPETGMTETCEGYICRMYEDERCKWELDLFHHLPSGMTFLTCRRNP